MGLICGVIQSGSFNRDKLRCSSDWWLGDADDDRRKHTTSRAWASAQLRPRVGGLGKILYVPVTRKVILTTENNSLPANHVYSMGCTVLAGLKIVPHQLNAFAGFLVRELMFTDVADLDLQ